jgi:hypothetical protein
VTRRRRWTIIGVGLAVGVGLIVAGAVVALQSKGAYSADDQSSFMAACTADAGAPAQPTCACIYDELSRTMPYAQFVTVNQQLGAQRTAGQPLQFPPTVDSIRVECVARSSGQTVVPTTG